LRFVLFALERFFSSAAKEWIAGHQREGGGVKLPRRNYGGDAFTEGDAQRTGGPG
jgi:hypothetical protein